MLFYINILYKYLISVIIIMSNYKIITDRDDIILKKKENKFKLEAKKQIKIPCDIISLAESLEIYNLFKLLNDKIITKCKIMKNTDSFDILLCLSNLLKNDNDAESDSSDSDEKNFYITWATNTKKISDNNIILEGKKNSITIDKEGWKKIEIDDIFLSIEIVGSELNIGLKFTYIGEKMPIYAENTIGLIFRKIIKNLLTYYGK